jgi:ABC-type amino acid transport substrate-binding protein
MRRVVTLALSLLLLAYPVSAAAEPVRLFYFSPDFSPGNLSVLTQAAEAYFRESKADTRFQAFVRYEDFAREVAAQKPEFVVVPDWANTTGCLGIELRALAKPVRGGESHGRKALVVRPTVRTFDDIAGGSIAATVPPGGSAPDSGLERIRREHPNVKIIPVPKEIDALLAVAFGQVDAAYVSTGQFGLLAGVSPKLGTDLKELGYAESTPFPMIYATAYASDAEIASVESAVATVATTGSGKRLIGLLGYDGWVAVDKTEADARRSKRAGEMCATSKETVR